MNIARFDPVAYKATTREQWQLAAEPWSRWGPALERWLGDATDVMLDLGRVKPGGRVLDVAAGAGGQTLAAARRVGPDGRVLATDISPNILDFAERAAFAAGLDERRHARDGRRAPRRRAGLVRHGHFSSRVHLLPRSAGGAARDAGRVAAGRATVGNRLLGGREAIRSSRSLSRSSAGGPGCPRRRPGSPVLSALVLRA